MLWQAVDGFRFRMAGGNIAPRPPEALLATPALAFVANGNGASASQA